MRQLRDSVWQRRGVSWLWDAEARAQVCQPSEILSLRQCLGMVSQWPDNLPSNEGNALVVAGLDGVLDLQLPTDAENWLGSCVKDAILSFQAFYEGQAALLFWLPSGASRLTTNSATDAVSWRCAPPNAHESLDFGRVLWGAAHEYPQEILLHARAGPVGLFHLRIT